MIWPLFVYISDSVCCHSSPFALIFIDFLMFWQQDDHPLSSRFSLAVPCSWNSLPSCIYQGCFFFSLDLSLSINFSGIHSLTILSNRIATLDVALFSYIRFIITWQSICLFLLFKKNSLSAPHSRSEFCENRGIV